MFHRMTIAVAVCFVFAGLLWIKPLSGQPAPPVQEMRWKDVLAERLPVFGQFNWIAVVDASYPLQVSPGVEVIQTREDLSQVVSQVLAEIKSSRHLRPIVHTTKEMKFIKETELGGYAAYRDKVLASLAGQEIGGEIEHYESLNQLNEAGQKFAVLVLKTETTMPYTGVFIELDPKTWDEAAEQRLRHLMR